MLLCTPKHLLLGTKTQWTEWKCIGLICRWDNSYQQCHEGTLHLVWKASTSPPWVSQGGWLQRLTAHAQKFRACAPQGDALAFQTSSRGLKCDTHVQHVTRVTFQTTEGEQAAGVPLCSLKFSEHSTPVQPLHMCSVLKSAPLEWRCLSLREVLWTQCTCVSFRCMCYVPQRSTSRTLLATSLSLRAFSPIMVLTRMRVTFWHTSKLGRTPEGHNVK